MKAHLNDNHSLISSILLSIDIFHNSEIIQSFFSIRKGSFINKQTNKQTMKNKIIATLVAFGLVGSASAIEINDNLSINGFIDASYQKTDNSGAGVNDNENLGLDEVEINFLLNVGSVSGQVSVDTDGASNDSNNDTSSDELFNIEQAHFTYSLDNGVSFTLGRYGRALGLEREDPAGLYTYSRAYGSNDNGDSYNYGNIDAGSGSVEGLTVSYSAEDFTVAVSFEEAAGADLVANDLNTQISVSYTGVENVVIGAGYFSDNAATAAAERNVFGVNATYTAGKALIGAEYISADDGDTTTGEDAFLVLVDYDVSDKLGVAVRYSEWEVSNTLEYSKITIAPNYALTESLGAILEYSDLDTGSANLDADQIALELTYTF